MEQFYLEESEGRDRTRPAPPGRASSGSDIDELNDETFGEGAIGGDWESAHYSEASGREEHRLGSSHNGSRATVQREDGEEEEVVEGVAKLKLKQLWPSSPERGSPLQSIWSSPELPHRGGGRSVAEKVVASPLPSVPPGSKVMTLEDLEKEIISTSPPPPLTTTTEPPNKPHPPAPPPGMVPLHHHHMPPGATPPRMMHPQMRPWVQVPGRGIPPGMMPSPPHMHFIRQRMGPPMLVAPGFPPPPHLHPSHPPPPPHMQHMLARMPHPPHQGHYPPGFTPPHFQQPPHPHNQQQGEPARRSRRSELLNEMKRDGSGFMTSREKEWVVKIQLLQLQSSDPTTDDYYYQNYVKSKLLRSSMDRESSNENGSSPTTTTSPLLTLPQVSREERNYKPIAFAGTLGKVSVSSISAPRKTIDAPLTGAGGGGAGEGGTLKESSLPTRDIYVKKRQTLMMIEKLFSLVLLCEELEQKALALLTGDREVRALLLAQKDDLCSLVFSLLKLKHLQLLSSKSDDAVLVQVATVRKGKRVLRRLLPLLSDADAAAVVFALVRNLATIIKKDSTDQVLLELSSDVGAVVATMALPTLSLLLAGGILQEGGGGGGRGGSIFPGSASNGGGSGGGSPSVVLGKMAGSEFGSALLLSVVRRGTELTAESNLPSSAQKNWFVLTQRLFTLLCQCRDTSPVTKSTVIVIETLASVQS